MNKQNVFRDIPKMDTILSWAEFHELESEFGRPLMKEAVSASLDMLRYTIRMGHIPADMRQFILETTELRLRQLLEPSLKPVINASGIIIHTNLGRAVLPEPVLEHLKKIGSHYNCLEYDLETGKRGHRDVHAERLAARFFGVESACIVNNNAAAVMLIINTFAEGKDVIVSRGELIEIGGSFRIPEIMKKAGARLKEVGTTNKTRLSDYATAIGPETGLVLKVHPSNYRVKGFTESVSASELAKLCAERKIPFAEDMGSGNVHDLRPLGIHDEPRVSDSVKSGVNLISFSGDKLLGSVQAGIIIGKREFLDLVRKNHLLRAMRVDKLVYAALEKHLILCLTGKETEIPVFRMLFESLSRIESRAAAFLTSLAPPVRQYCELVDSSAKIGGGTTPEREIPSIAVALSHPELSADKLSERLRTMSPPVIGRIHEDRFLLDFRTILEDELDFLRAHVNRLFDL